ncbi:GTPase [Serinibacter salmoneus]|uniref:GTP-binding protein EngB required for normal cell division n=1 Tax=Serinibacter salmoneus TaxID=556530 RepID=A0A2A9D0P8_9MICO|nr:GTPase [Serinibacter salmoneus]PFG19956.1 GTP-binding protein EngB required for normal cell division [Serinibacter salmoneus]
MSAPIAGSRRAARAMAGSADSVSEVQVREEGRLEILARLVDDLGALLPAPVRDAAREHLGAVEQRLAMGLNHTVVAFVGGTGSGKSSLFNAVTALDVAEVGVRRPTTSRPSACVWGSDATSFLDHLGVAPAARVRGETALEGPDPRELAGVILLDVPDHDSVELEHRDLVNKLVPFVDLLVWVLDPQKYADHRLHADYLRALSGRQDGMLVVLNQVDTLTPQGTEQVLADVRELLVADGLDEVGILPASATSGVGVQELRGALVAGAQRASVNRTAVRDELDGVARALEDALGPPPGHGQSGGDAVQRLWDMTGARSAADSYAAAVRGEGSVTVELREPTPARLEALRQGWVAAECRGLPAQWHRGVGDALPSAETIGERAMAAVRSVPAPPVRTPGAFRKMRRASLEAEADRVRAQYAADVTQRLQDVVLDILGPSRAVRARLTSAHERLAQVRSV